MKKLAKILALALAVMMLLGSVSLAETDLEYVKNKGVLVVGITDFEPMDYKDEAGEWIGFDRGDQLNSADLVGGKVTIGDEVLEVDLLAGFLAFAAGIDNDGNIEDVLDFSDAGFDFRLTITGGIVFGVFG